MSTVIKSLDIISNKGFCTRTVHIARAELEKIKENITEEEYNQIMEIIRNKPVQLDGFDYRLKEDLIWEQYKLPERQSDYELTSQEALDVIVGGKE